MHGQTARQTGPRRTETSKNGPTGIRDCQLSLKPISDRMMQLENTMTDIRNSTQTESGTTAEVNEKVDRLIELTTHHQKESCSWAHIASSRMSAEGRPDGEQEETAVKQPQPTFETNIKHILKEVLQEKDYDRESELKEREKRANNIVIFRAKEPASENKNDSVKEDEALIQGLLEEIGCGGTNPEQITRLGKKDKDRRRPLRFNVKDTTQKAAIMAALPRLGEAQEPYKSIVVSHDLTPLQREERKKLYSKASEETPPGYKIIVKSEPGPRWDPKIVKLKKKLQ